MILMNNVWIDIIPADYMSFNDITGKWLYFEDTQKLHALVEELNQLVESGAIRAAKITRKLPEHDPFPEKPCVLCVFTSNDPKEKEEANKLIKNRFNLYTDTWKSELQTMQDWEEDGRLRIQADLNQIRRDIKEGKVSDIQSAKKRYFVLLEKLESVLKDIDDPNKKAEIHIEMIHELSRRIETNLIERNFNSQDILNRLNSLENELGALTLKIESGEIGYREQNMVQVDHKFIFVIMPFAKNHIDTYDTIKRAAKRIEQQLKVERIDEKPGSFAITDEIHRSIQKADLIICDLTEARPNVYYELGYARGLGKSIISIARVGTNLHFDVYGFKTIFFETYRNLEESLSNEIGLLFQDKGDTC